MKSTFSKIALLGLASLGLCAPVVSNAGGEHHNKCDKDAISGYYYQNDTTFFQMQGILGSTGLVDPNTCTGYNNSHNKPCADNPFDPNGSVNPGCSCTFVCGFDGTNTLPSYSMLILHEDGSVDAPYTVQLAVLDLPGQFGGTASNPNGVWKCTKEGHILITIFSAALGGPSVGDFYPLYGSRLTTRYKLGPLDENGKVSSLLTDAKHTISLVFPNTVDLIMADSDAAIAQGTIAPPFNFYRVEQDYEGDLRHDNFKLPTYPSLQHGTKCG